MASSYEFLLLLAFLIIIAYYLPYFILGENSKITIHDNLDANIVWTKAILDNKMFFAHNGELIPQFMNGIPRESLSGNFDLCFMWFKFFGMYWGLVANKLIMSLAGFWGMFLLLKEHVISCERNVHIQIGVALLFALLPFWSFTLSVAGLPLLLYAFLNLRKNKLKFTSLIIITVIPFYSSLVLSAFFFLLLIVAIIFWDIYCTKHINWGIVKGLLIVSVLYTLSHIRIFYSFLIDKSYISHRIEFKGDSIVFADSIKEALNMFFKGHYHSHSLHGLIIIPLLFSLYIAYKTRNAVKIKTILLLFMALLLIAVFYGLWSWSGLALVKQFCTSILPIQLQRFHFLYPLLWYILLAISLEVINNTKKYGKLLVISFIGIQLFYIVSKHEIFVNRNIPTYKEFYSAEQFAQIRQYIALPMDSYKVISIGLHPAVAQYNGFYTLDGYCADYPLEYKHKFRSIIKNELAKDTDLRNYFDRWGSRCYAFSSELGRNFIFRQDNDIIINKLDYNFNKLEEFGCKFIISTVKINTFENPNCKFIKMFSQSNYYWKINLYEIKK